MTFERFLGKGAILGFTLKRSKIAHATKLQVAQKLQSWGWALPSFTMGFALPTVGRPLQLRYSNCYSSVTAPLHLRYSFH